MVSKERMAALLSEGRHETKAVRGDDDLGYLKEFPGTWSNVPHLTGAGWNLIALPFRSASLDYRLMINQYNEVLKFDLADKVVANRGLEIERQGDPAQQGAQNLDQTLVALDYEQVMEQVHGEDFPPSGRLPRNNQRIHHEPGLWLNILGHTTDDLKIARLATIPHGNSVLAMGPRPETDDGAPNFDDVSNITSFPKGGPNTTRNPYLAPYAHFHANPVANRFDPRQLTAPLKRANRGLSFTKTTRFEVDTTLGKGSGISNIPFIIDHADATSMRSIFWVSEYQARGGGTRARLQYLQIVMLDFFDRTDGQEGRIQWPHISLNTLELSNNR